MTIIGTAYFVSRATAIRYYRNYEDSLGAAINAVEDKLIAGEIHLGVPPLMKGAKLHIIDNGCRYAIEP